MCVLDPDSTKNRKNWFFNAIFYNLTTLSGKVDEMVNVKGQFSAQKKADVYNIQTVDIKM